MSLLDDRLTGPPVTGWSKTELLTPGDTNIVQLQVKFAKAGYYTIQFAIDYPDNAFSEAGEILTDAEIIWTVAGNPILRRIGVVNGTTISGMGEAVAINISDRSTAILDPYRVKVSTAAGTRPGVPNPPIYAPDTAQFILPGNVATFNIPINVGVNAVYINVSPDPFDILWTADLFSQFVRGTTNLRRIWAEHVNRWIPLAPSDSIVEIRLAAGAPAGLQILPIYGIEG